MKKLLLLLTIIPFFASSCRKEIINAPTGLSYEAPNSIKTFAGTSGFANLATINWNGNIGKFAIASVGASTLLDGGIAGLTIDPNSGRITWTEKTPAGSYIINVNAVNDGGSISALADTLQISGVSYGTLDYGNAVASIVYNGLIKKESLSPTVIPKGTTGTYTTTGTLPNGVTIDANTGNLSWTNLTTKATTAKDTTHEIKIYFAPSSGSAQINPITVSLTVKSAAQRIVYASTSISYNVGSTDDSVTDAPSLIDTASGNFSVSYGITYVITKLASYPVDIYSTTKTGISINTKTGVLTFAKSLAAGVYTIRINKGSFTTDYTLTIRDYFSYSKNSEIFISNGTAAKSVTPDFIGLKGVYLISAIEANIGGVKSTPKAVPGILLDPSTGVISWSGAIAAGVYTITVQNSNNSASTVKFTLTVN